MVCYLIAHTYKHKNVILYKGGGGDSAHYYTIHLIMVCVEDTHTVSPSTRSAIGVRLTTDSLGFIAKSIHHDYC